MKKAQCSFIKIKDWNVWNVKNFVNLRMILGMIGVWRFAKVSLGQY